jgi:predicted AAA+ superfamily ATPase
MIKSRTLSNTLKTMASSPLGRILIVTGARQTGKTTLLRHCFPGYQYISIEDPLLRSAYRNLTAQQWAARYKTAILDEIQKEPQLIESIKAVYDLFPEPRYVLSGSSQLLLMQKVKESLAGRCHIEELYPLTLPEMLTNSWADTPRSSIYQTVIFSSASEPPLPSIYLYSDHEKRIDAFSYYLEFGGYPALVNEALTNDDRRMWLRDYVRTYLERDIRDLADFRSLEPFINLQKTAALRTGQLVNFASLAKEVSINAKTAQKFLTYMELSYQTILLHPWYQNHLKRLSKSPKLHFLDPGIQRTIIQRSGPLTGNEYESAVIAELYKQAMNLHLNLGFYHLRTLDGREIDLLIESEKGYFAIEIKSGNKVHDQDTRNFRELDKLLNKPLLQSFILSNDPEVKSLKYNVTAIPAALFLT